MRDQWSMSNSPKSEPANNDLQFKRPWLVPRRIARELGIDRETVGRYLRLAKPAISTTGIEEAGEAKPAISIAGNGVGRKSQCEPPGPSDQGQGGGRAQRQRIYQDLVGEHGFTDSYQSVKRFMRKLRERPNRAGLAFGMPTGRRAPAGFLLGSSDR